MKKFLFVSHSSSLYGGGEDDFERMLKYYSTDSQNYIVDAIFPKGERANIYKKYCRKSGIYKFGYFPEEDNKIIDYIKYFVKFFIQYRDFNKFIGKEKYDVCFINVSVLLWPVLILKLKRFKLIVFIKETINSRVLRYLVFKYLNIFADYFISVSNKNEIEYRNITKSDNITTLYSAIESDSRRYEIDDNVFKNKLGNEIYNCLIRKEVTKLLNVGPIVNRKNQYFIVKTLNFIKANNYTDVPYVFFIGSLSSDEKYYNNVKRYIELNGLSKYCFFLNTQPKEILYKMYKYVDALLVASKSEGFPLVLVEAFNFKVPVLSTKSGGITDFIKDEKTGLLFEFNEKSMAEKIKSIANSKDLKFQITENAFKLCEMHFNFEKNMKILNNIIYRLLNSGY